MMNRHPDIMFMAEYIKSILYFATVRQGKSLRSTPEIHYFCTDNDLVYENYYSDFGPLNLGCVYKYCRILNDKINQYLNKQTIVYYTSVEPRKKTNAAFLLGCYGVLYLSLTPRDALKPLLVQGQYYRPFQDATQGDSDFTISLMDCLQAINKARALRFFNFQDFNYDEYERLDKIQGGDLNWIVPGKFLAFIGPVDLCVSLYHPPEMYIDYFLENDVKIVMRLNKRLYDGNVFNNTGILHYDLFFPDGSCPPRHILFKFLQISEESNCAIAVHCKAGLGRTGSLIGCYLIKHYKMTSHEAIGWMRICRPGSVIGHQQAWLEKLESWLIKIGNLYRKNTYQDTERLPYHEFGVYSIAEKNAKPQPVLFHKSPSPPPPMRNQSLRSSDLLSPMRPKHSRMKEDITDNEDDEEKEIFIASCDLTTKSTGPMRPIKGCVLMSTGEENDDNNLYSEIINKAAEKQSDRRMNVKLLSNNQVMTHSNEHFALSNASSRQSSGAGDPRNVRPTSRNSMSRYSRLSDYRKSNASDIVSVNGPTNNPASTFRARQAPVLKNVNDVKSFLTRSSIYSSEGDRENISSSIIVTPQMRTQARLNSYAVTPHITGPPAMSSAARASSQFQNRRRLGRSPSPQPRMVNEQTRATNTPSPTEKFLGKDASKSALRDVLSKLKLTTTTYRDGSLGAASLGAKRDAPAPRCAPSVKSDERPLATQGDMLNSIKFQRRLRDTWTTDKIIVPAKTSIKLMNSKTSSLNKSVQGSIGNVQNFSGNKEKPVLAPRGFGNPVRPLSPKGRRMPQSSKFD